MNSVLAGLGAVTGEDLTDLGLRGLQIIWINILLSGDNAVVIALACRKLDGRRRAWAIAGGASLAVGLRIVLTFFVVAMLGLPFVKLIGGVLLFWIAFDLLRSHEAEEVAAAVSIWGAVRTIAVADLVMSLDNVVAVAAAAKNSMPLIVFGIALSVPLIVFGSTLILVAMRRFPILVVAGAVLLGSVAGSMLATEPLLARPAARLPVDPELAAEIVGALLVLAAALVLWLIRRRSASSPAVPQSSGRTGAALVPPHDP